MELETVSFSARDRTFATHTMQVGLDALIPRDSFDQTATAAAPHSPKRFQFAGRRIS
jgi:hypothetical protein